MPLELSQARLIDFLGNWSEDTPLRDLSVNNQSGTDRSCHADSFSHYGVPTLLLRVSRGDQSGVMIPPLLCLGILDHEVVPHDYQVAVLISHGEFLREDFTEDFEVGARFAPISSNDRERGSIIVEAKEDQCLVVLLKE